MSNGWTPWAVFLIAGRAGASTVPPHPTLETGTLARSIVAFSPSGATIASAEASGAITVAANMSVAR